MIKKFRTGSWILAAVVAVSLTACGGGGGNASGASTSAPAAATASDTSSTSAASSASAASESSAEANSASETSVEKSTGSDSAAGQEDQDTEESKEASASTASSQSDGKETGASEDSEAEDDASASAAAVSSADAPEIAGLTFDHAMELEDAEHFDVYYYNDGFKLIDVPESGQYLIIPEGEEAPEGIDPEIYLLYQPLDQVYMAATGSMSFLDQIDAIDNVTMSSLDKDGWMIDAPKDAMESGKMVYAGKYSEPDYEMMIGNGCDVAIESTMILHSPEVQEMIEDLGIPVFIDRSSYELDAFGRIEWIKLYGAMFNKEELAKEKFDEQKAVLDTLKDFENTGKTVAFFAVNTNNTITVRRSEDFIPNMIELAGGKYIFENLSNPNSTSASVRISMEEFYNAAVNADFLIYNGTIEAPLKSIDDLIGKDALFAEFKAVKEGNVWTVDKTWYQSTATIGYLITDLNRMLTGGDPSEMVFLKKVE